MGKGGHQGNGNNGASGQGQTKPDVKGGKNGGGNSNNPP